MAALGEQCRTRFGQPAKRLARVLLTLSGLALSGCAGIFGGTEEAAAPAATAQRQDTAPVAQVPTPAPAAGLPSAEQEGSPALSGPEFFRGRGSLFGRPGARRAEVDVTEGGGFTFNFENVELREVVDVILGDTLQRNYIIDPRLQGIVTARTSSPIARASVIPVLENILALNGAALISSDETFKVVPLSDAATSFATPVVSPTPRDLAAGFGIHIIPLQFVAAEALRNVVAPFVSPGRVLQADPNRNLLVFAGTGTEARDLLDMVDVFDVDWIAGMSFALIPVEVADVGTVAAELEIIFGQEGTSPVAGLVRFVPIERLNALLVISPQATFLDQALAWIERLDRGQGGAGRRIFVYFVQNRRATDLAETLSEVVAAVDAETTGTGRVGSVTTRLLSPPS